MPAAPSLHDSHLHAFCPCASKPSEQQQVQTRDELPHDVSAPNLQGFKYSKSSSAFSCLALRQRQHVAGEAIVGRKRARGDFAHIGRPERLNAPRVGQQRAPRARERMVRCQRGRHARVAPQRVHQRHLGGLRPARSGRHRLPASNR